MINSIEGFTLKPQIPLETTVERKPAGGFSTSLSSMLERLNKTQAAGDQAIEQLQSGKARYLHDVMIAVEEADISLRMAVQIRNRALSAYEEIMRMQL